jgi:hypothetical protein
MVSLEASCATMQKNTIAFVLVSCGHT